jgi:hypothetical protein
MKRITQCEAENFLTGSKRKAAAILSASAAAFVELI